MWSCWGGTEIPLENQRKKAYFSKILDKTSRNFQFYGVEVGGSGFVRAGDITIGHKVTGEDL